MLQTLDAVIGRRIGIGVVQLTRGDAVQGVVHQRRLPRSGNTGHARHEPQRQLQIDILEIVATRTAKTHDAILIERRALVRNADLPSPADVLAGQ